MVQTSSSPSSSPQPPELAPLLSILVIDDEKDILALYKIFIKIAGYETICFTNPVLALEHYNHEQDRCSMIITDLRMPGMNGIELARKIREMNSAVKIYLITAYDTSEIESQQACQEARFDLILEKPIDFLKLKKMIEQDLSLNS